MSGGQVRKVSRQDIQLVQNLIERCLQLYMDQKEVVDTLLTQAKIEPDFTELVHQIPPCYLSEDASTSSRTVSALCRGGSSSSTMNGVSSAHRGIQAGIDASIIIGKLDGSTSMLSTHNSHMGGFHGMDGPTIKSEPSYTSNSDFSISADDSFLEARPSIGDAGGSFSSLELNGTPLSESLLDIDTPPFGFLSQIPRNFSFSDLTDFSQGADILENYGRSPFLAPEANNFADSPQRGYDGGFVYNWKGPVSEFFTLPNFL